MNDTPATRREVLPPEVLKRLGQVVGRFESALRSGQRPIIEDYLGDTPEPDRSALLAELLRLELIYRRAEGRTPRPENYRLRFPQHGPLIQAVCHEERGHLVPVPPPPDPQEEVIPWVVAIPSQAPHREEEGSPAPQFPDAGLPALEEEEIPTVLPVFSGFGFWAAFGLTLVLLLAQFGIGFVLGIVLVVQSGIRRPDLDTPFLAVASAIISFVAMLVLVGVGLGSQTRRALALRGTSFLHLCLVLLLVPPLVILSQEIGRWVTQGLDLAFPTLRPEMSALAHGTQGGAAPVAYFKQLEQGHEQLARQPWVVVFLLGCLLPGVGEELFFRGFLGRGLVARYGAVRGVLCTSVLFGAMHFDPDQVCYTLVAGIVLHVVYLTTKTLWCPIVLHTLYNCLGFAETKLSLEGTFNPNDLNGFLNVPPFLGLAALAAVVVLGVLFYRSRVRWVQEDGREWSPGYLSAEIHPAAVAAVPRYRLPGWGAVLLFVCTYAVFGGALAWAMPRWLDSNELWTHLYRASTASEKGNYQQAITAYNEVLRLAPNHAPTHAARGDAHRVLGNDSQALDDLNRALQLNPRLPQAHASRGATYLQRHDHERALADCNRAIQLDGQLAWGYTIRGDVRQARGEYGQAVQDWKESLRLDPKYFVVYRVLAWLLATCPEARHRDGPRAVEHATRACELTQWKDTESLMALAAAHAECGQFGEAVRRQEQALHLATDVQKAMHSHLLDMYRAGQPYREPPASYAKTGSQ